MSDDAIISIVRDEHAGYADQDRIYAMVRQALAAIDPDAAARPEWNPLGRWIARGSRVFVLPNFVSHRQPHESRDAFDAKCTNASVLRPILDYAILAAGPGGRIQMGNASLQSCDYQRVSDDTGASELRRIYSEKLGYDVGPFDLRELVSRWTRYGALLETEVHDSDNAIAIDLGTASALEPLYRTSDGNVNVRVGDYDPDVTQSFHAPGTHVYRVDRRLLEADVVISAPKLKTHQKVGITCALKGMVGTITRKECLAHHRRGGPAEAGDEYRVSSPLHTLASALGDRSAALGSNFAANAVRVASKVLYRSLRLGQGVVGGSWHGNDTAWRMVMDIARILIYARPDGTMTDTPQRKHLAFIDGVIAGEGEGPLRPVPKHCGVVMFGSDVVWTDMACALLMGFDPERIPMLHHASQRAAGITPVERGDVRLLVDGGEVPWTRLADAYGFHFQTPKGWTDHMQLSAIHG